MSAANGLHPGLTVGEAVLDLPASGVQSHAANVYDFLAGAA